MEATANFPTPRPTTSPSDFEYLQVLGSGSYGTVHLARRRLDGSLHAIKIVTLGKLSHAEQLESVVEAQVRQLGRANLSFSGPCTASTSCPGLPRP